MDKREKVINALTGCSNVQSGFTDAVYVCPTCMYGREDGTPCESLHPLLDDALELLKAQKSRLLTLEEVDALEDSALIYIECIYSIDGQHKTVIKPAIYQADNSSPEEDGYYCIVSAWGQSGFYHVDGYETDWRCWNREPTKEQMEATPWKD